MGSYVLRCMFIHCLFLGLEVLFIVVIRPLSFLISLSLYFIFCSLVIQLLKYSTTQLYTTRVSHSSILHDGLSDGLILRVPALFTRATPFYIKSSIAQAISLDLVNDE